MRHFASAQYWDRPAVGDTGRLFLAFGGLVCADRNSICPLDRVLTYKKLIVSTGSIWWVLWFSVRYAGAAARREIFGINALRGKRQQLGSPNLQDIFIGG